MLGNWIKHTLRRPADDIDPPTWRKKVFLEEKLSKRSEGSESFRMKHSKMAAVCL